MMTTIEHPRFLQRILLVDAATCIGMGAVLLYSAEALRGATNLEAGLLRVAGLLLLPIGAYILLVSTRAAKWPVAVAMVVGGNAGWVMASLVLLAGGFAHPNALGIAFVLAQALGVAVLAALEWLGLRAAGCATVAAETR